MPKLTNLDQLTLHSASSQMVSTPFATDSTKFEYPFPEDVSSYSPSASSSTYGTPAILTPPLSSGSTFPFISASPRPAADLAVSHPTRRFLVVVLFFLLLHIFFYTCSPQTQTTHQSTSTTFAGQETPKVEFEHHGSQEERLRGRYFLKTGSMNLIDNFLRKRPR
jgi:hypothetical protein